MTKIKRKEHFRWRCPTHCKYEQSWRHGSILASQKLSCGQFLWLARCWAFDFLQSDAAEWVGVCYETVCTWFDSFREICCWYLVRNPQQKGGIGVKVEVDESVISKRKYNRGRSNWESTGKCPEQNQCFVELVANRRAPTLNAILERNVAPGSIICTDIWRGYSQVAAIPVDPPFEHRTVNHSENFVDPDDGTCTNHVERGWGQIKTKFKRMNGCHDSKLTSRLNEAIWRQHFAPSKMDAFRRLITQIAMKFPIDRPPPAQPPGLPPPALPQALPPPQSPPTKFPPYNLKKPTE